MNMVADNSTQKTCQLIFCAMSVKYKPISIKISRHVLEGTLNRTVQKFPNSPKVCAIWKFEVTD